MKKCKCGNDVARNAKACPKCGHRFTGTFTKSLAVLFGIIVVMAIIGGALGGGSGDSASTTNATNNPAAPPPSPEQRAAQEAARQKAAADAQKKETAFQHAVAGAKQLRESMRNPDSFKLTQVLVMGNGASCYEFRSQNGFGGVNVGQAALSAKGRFRTSESDNFSPLWNRECANKTGEDKTWEVGYAAGFHGLSNN
jgi:hypothetical protein